MDIQPIHFTKRSARQAIGSLSDTSKMPGKSWGIPVARCVTGSRLAQIPGTVCANCYAMKGHYALFHRAIEAAQARRLAAIERPEWVSAMTTALADARWFRWFDAGDLQSVDMLQKIAAVCRATPETHHWLATRERGFVRRFLATDTVPANLVIRVSATWPDVPVKPLPGVQLANVHKMKPPVGYACPAPMQGNHCGPCRACWDRAVPVVSYHWH